MIQSKFPKWTLALTLGLLALPAAHAGDNEPNCEDPQSTSEMNVCAGIELEKADKDLNDLYQAIVRKLDGNGETEALAALRRAQRAWVAFRQADVEAGILHIWPEGSGRTHVEVGLHTSLTKDRTAQLKRTYVDTESGE